MGPLAWPMDNYGPQTLSLLVDEHDKGSQGLPGHSSECPETVQVEVKSHLTHVGQS